MSEEQMSLPVFAVILLVSGLIVRYLFFSGPAPTQPPLSSRSAEAQMRSRELAVERIQQMFPQVERRAILWSLQRNGGSIQNTTERILAGRLETPPVTFQPPPPPPNQQTQSAAPTAAKQPEMFRQPDLITRYNLRDRLDVAAGDGATGTGTGTGMGMEDKDAAPGETKSKGWSSNREERQASLKSRRDEMILAARRKMEAKIAAEKAAGEH
ncbi:Coupling of ubiquitin conjugation to ER degradation protein 1 [Escovopsis weberi]|uniref:Coupling of ubiquitin conjugation to ER degradation protein 1 n=1 Tax=Escovopsis weberi TaxID=150374 RepID=A0A0M8MS52_ESCWE|nr:Coupling of ubiquitin conjugation to ER degradation protein 1 [Escovopsis weberi]